MLVISVFSYKLLVMLNINIPSHRECTIITANLKIFFESGKKFFPFAKKLHPDFPICYFTSYVNE